MASAQKPLPAIPALSPEPTVATLTDDGRAHLRAFIRYALCEEGLGSADTPDVDSERVGASWATEFERALDELGRCLAADGWLAGLRTARRASEERVDAEEARRVERKAAAEKDARKRAAAKENAAEGTDGQDTAEKRGSNVETRLEGTTGAASSQRHPSVQVPKSNDPGAQQEAERTDLALTQLGELIARATESAKDADATHMLLAVSSAGRLMRSRQDQSLDVVPSRPGCVFSPGLFARTDDGKLSGVVLFGLDNWDVDMPVPSSIVGGTFALRGVASSAQFDALARCLRLALYVRLSLVLEQQLFADAHVELHFPPPPAPPPPSPAVLRKLPPPPEPPSPTKGKPRPASVGIWTFLTKKRDHIVQRTVALAPNSRRGSLDHPSNTTQAPSPDAAARQRTFSFLTDLRPSPLGSQAPVAPPAEPAPTLLFSTTLDHLEETKGLLSASAGLRPPVPTILHQLAAKERADPERRLTGDEKTALTSLLGWEGKGKATRAKELSGLSAFVRHQTFSVLYSEHVPTAIALALPPTPSTNSSSSTTSNGAPPATSDTSSASALSADSATSTPTMVDHVPPVQLYTQCTDRRRWVSHRFYSRDRKEDRSLGRAVRDFCTSARNACTKAGCAFTRGEHQLRWIHGGVRIILKVECLPEDEEGEAEKAADDDIWMWEKCQVCEKAMERRRVSDGTYLFSFAKFLELLVYSPALCNLTPALCEHTTPPKEPSAQDIPLPRSRLNIVRVFKHKSRKASFWLSLADDVFELRVPRIQIMKGGVAEKSLRVDDRTDTECTEVDEKRALRREIRNWWGGVSDHIDKLELEFVEHQSYHLKSLPRLPSVDDQDDDVAETPKAEHAQLPFPSESSGQTQASATTTASGVTQGTTESGTKPLPTEKPLPADSLRLLTKLRHSFQRTEHTLYSELSQTPTTSLNDVRRSFHGTARGAMKRLSAWEHKHLTYAPGEESPVGKLLTEEPEWWASGWHAVPGGSVILREQDWGSIIAFTLSSVDYRRELADFAVARIPSGPVSVPESPQPGASGGASRKSYFTDVARNKLFRSQTPRPDPDQEDVIWNEPEVCSAVISRKQHPRDPTYLLSLRDVLRHKRPLDGSSGTPLSHIIGAARRVASGTPASAWAKPAVEVSMQEADGDFVEPTPENVEAAAKLLQELEAATESSPGSIFSGTFSSSSELGDTHIRRGKGPSLNSSENGASAGSSDNASIHTVTQASPGKDRDVGAPGEPSDSKMSTQPSSAPDGQPSSYTTSITNSLTTAMRFVLKASDSMRPPTANPRTHHSLLSVDPLAIDERPHVKYDFTVGKIRFSCTVYYAKQFDVLRRRCGIEDVFMKSMERSANWAADGGKSKSNFWKTEDNRFIIKTLVNAWNVADLQVLLELAPSYFRYQDKTASRATALAKLLGFYTVEIRNLESGATQAKADLLVMENLFYDQQIVKTFDLKGIQGRKVKATSGNKTLFDGEWVEGQQRALTLVYPHSKLILQEAVKHDCDFLAESNIMDYSLLLGVDEARKELACGLVDTIGSYTFAKTLEYKAKQGLNAGKDKQVTVVPPREYEERFVSAIEGYFVACPDKWSKPLDGTKVVSDPDLIPSVL